MALKASEVFVPGAYPTHTCVERGSERLEQSLKDSLETPGQIISPSGPSKSGKTVLVERVVGKDYLIEISGVGITSPDDLWNRVLDWMDLPNSTTSSRTFGGPLGGETKGSGGISIPGIVQATGSAGASAEITASRERSNVRERRGLAQVQDEIANSEFAILIDDFHYMPREAQLEVAKGLKEAVRLGIRSSPPR